MADPHLLADYQSLVRDHASRFDPAIQQLQQLVAQQLAELRQQEQDLVTAQMVALRRIFQSLADDARCLLPTPELAAVVQTLKQANVPYWWRYQGRPDLVAIAEDPTQWRLAQLEHPVRLTQYQEHVDPDAYAADRTFTLYFYTLQVQMGDCRQSVTVPTERHYNVRDRRQYSQREQQDSLYESVLLLFRDRPHNPVEQVQLAQELSCLLCYARQVLAMKPRTTQFWVAPEESQALTYRPKSLFSTNVPALIS